MTTLQIYSNPKYYQTNDHAKLVRIMLPISA